MALVQFTRPDGSPIALDPADVHAFSPVPPSGSPDGGPLDEGTRITFKNGAHQDVKELFDEVERRLAAAH